MKKRHLPALLLLLVLCAGFRAPALAQPFETMTRPPEETPWQALGEETDIYLMHKGDRAVTVRAKPSSSAKSLYAWRRFALRKAEGEQPSGWYKVALPGAEGYVQAALTYPLEEEGRPRLRVYTQTASLGYVYVAAAGEVPLVAEIQNGEKHHQLLLPGDGRWQPVLLSLGAGEYRLSIYEAGLYDWPIRLLLETSFSAETVPADTALALFSSLHTNMEDHPVTVALARSLTRNATTDVEKATLLWDWLMKHAAYDKALARAIQFSEIPDGDAFIRGEKGICSDFAAFMAVGLRAVGVPAKHVYGKNLRTGNQHAWNEVFLEGEWQIIDATMAYSRGPRAFHAEKEKNYARETGLWDGFH